MYKRVLVGARDSDEAWTWKWATYIEDDDIPRRTLAVH